LYPNIKFFVSASASLILKTKESLARRIFYFHLDMLSFKEFLELKGKNFREIKRREL
jgi:predicted AAA+ superfamily ATPase